MFAVTNSPMMPVALAAVWPSVVAFRLEHPDVESVSIAGVEAQIVWLGSTHTRTRRSLSTFSTMTVKLACPPDTKDESVTVVLQLGPLFGVCTEMRIWPPEVSLRLIRSSQCGVAEGLPPYPALFRIACHIPLDSLKAIEPVFLSEAK